jgi:hypothetical protein
MILTGMIQSYIYMKCYVQIFQLHIFMYKARIWTPHGLSVTPKTILCTFKSLRASWNVFL